MTLSKRLTRLESRPLWTPARDLCHCPNRFDYRRGIDALDPERPGAVDNGTCQTCGKPTGAIPITLIALQDEACECPYVAVADVKDLDGLTICPKCGKTLTGPKKGYAGGFSPDDWDTPQGG